MKEKQIKFYRMKVLCCKRIVLGAVYKLKDNKILANLGVNSANKVQRLKQGAFKTNQD